MVFFGVFNLTGTEYTYREFWVIVLGSYGAFVVASGLTLSVICSNFSRSGEELRKKSHTKRFKVIAICVAVLYMVAMFMLALLNGLFVFGGDTIVIYLAALLATQTIFGLIGSFVRAPYLADTIAIASNWCVAGACMFLIQLPGMFDYVRTTWALSLAAGIPLGVVGATTYIHYAFYKSDREETAHMSRFSKYSYSVRKVWFWLAVLVSYGIGIFFTFFFAGTCIAVYLNPENHSHWVAFGGTLFWNSRLLRSTNYCLTTPCHVYLTAGSDLTSEVFINVHVPIDGPSQLSVVVNGNISVSMSESAMPLLDTNDQRRVFSAYVRGLSEGAEQSFQIMDETAPIGEETYYFRTAGVGGFSFVTGGDSGSSVFAQKIISEMVAKKPDLLVVGGDIAYDNGMISCACVWDTFLEMIEKNRIDGKYLVPLSFAAGNHDLGVNDSLEAATFNIDMSEKSCDLESIKNARPLYFAWFPHEAILGDDGQYHILPICQRTTIRKHFVKSSASVWILDSAYAVTPAGNAQFVTDNYDTAADPSVPQFAVYHVPLYSALEAEYKITGYLRDAWPESIFDKYGFTACFENHAHEYKRTQPLIANTPSSAGGTIYLGDGRMGTDGSSDPKDSSVTKPAENPVFALTGAKYHFFHVVVDGTKKVSITAVDEKGEVFDQIAPGFTPKAKASPTTTSTSLAPDR